MAFRLSAGGAAHRRKIETIILQSGNQVTREAGMAGIVAIRLWLLIALAGPSQWIGLRCGFGISDDVAIPDADRRHVAVIEQFLLIVTDDDQGVEPRRGNFATHLSNRGLRVGVALLQRLGAHQRRGLCRRVRQQVLVARRPAGKIDKGSSFVAADKGAALPVFRQGTQHRTVRGPETRDQLGHDVSSR